MLAIHRTNEDKKAVLFVYDGNQVQKFHGEDEVEKVAALKPDTIRLVSASTTDMFNLQLHKNGCKILNGHFHNLGLDVGLTPEEITKKLYSLPVGFFNEIIPNADLIKLKHFIGMRREVLQAAGDLIRRTKQRSRNRLEDEELSAQLDIELRLGKSIKSMTADFEGRQLSLDTIIFRIARNFPEYHLFRQVADLKGDSIWAATVIALVGGIERFPSVSSLWHYCGEHVVDGKAPKLTRGKPADWNHHLRAANYQGVESIIKNRDNKWRAFYDEAKAKELEIHSLKCKCENPQNHSHFRAMRLMKKEILKEFWLACQPKGGAIVGLEPKNLMPPQPSSA